MTQYIADEAHFKEVIERAAKVKSSLWIGTADIKDLYVEEHPFLGVIADLIKKLPKSIDFGFGEYDLEMSTKGEYVEVQYENDYDDYTPFFCANLSLIESLYRILCWLAENHKELL